MGTGRHGQGGHLPPGNVVQCFYALAVTAKLSVDELFMQYFHKLSSASGGFTPDPTGASSLDPAGGGAFVPRPLICPPLEKNPAGAHKRG